MGSKQGLHTRGCALLTLLACACVVTSDSDDADSSTGDTGEYATSISCSEYPATPACVSTTVAMDTTAAPTTASVSTSDDPSTTSLTSDTTTGACNTGCGTTEADSGGVVEGLFSTDFPDDEDPISQGGIWVNGASDGLLWHDVRTTPGEAFGASTVDGYDDCIAHLDVAYHDFAPDQYAEGVVHRVDGYSPSVSHEIELLLRFSITPNDAHGYEILWAHSGPMAIVRWNGPLGDYTPLLDNIDIGGPASDGEVLRAEIVGEVISVYRNGELVATGPANDTWTDGQPGIGFWPKTDATPQSYGWASYAAGEM